MIKTTKEIIEAYKNGYNATLFDEKTLERVLSKLEYPLFGDAAQNIAGSGAGKLALNYKLVQKYDKTFAEDESQLTGDCTSHACRNATTLSIVGDIEERLETEEYKSRLATEAIYGYRGHFGEGMSVALAAQFVSETGGIALRKKYGVYDLTKYNPKVGINWGRTGVPKSVVSEISENKALTTSLCTSVDQLRDAIYNGYGVMVGSNMGFSSTRNKNGTAKISGSWNHALSFGAMDDTLTYEKECLFLILNSWGEWNAGPKIYEQPNGSFWVTATVAERMIRQKQTWIIGNIKGFKTKKINWDSINEIL
jgi:hypothetical protein